MNPKLSHKILLFFLVFFTAWWLWMYLTPMGSDDLITEYFSATYGFVALFGGLYGLVLSKKWGGFQSYVGKAVSFFSLGLLAQEFGQLAYSFYSLVLHVEIPYPSIGDLGYFGSIPLYFLGIYFLAKACGMSVLLESKSSKFIFVLVPFVMLSFSYYMFLQGYEYDWSAPLMIALDFGYPLGQSLYVSLALVTFLLSRKVLGGIMRGKILMLLFALFVQYVADFHFLYLVSRELWNTAGINEYLYFLAYVLMVFALLKLESVFDSVEEKETAHV